MTAKALLANTVAQLRVPLALAGAHDGRVIGAGPRLIAGPVRAQESSVGGVEAEVFRPGRGSGPWPAVVVLPGVTRRGRAHPALRAVAKGLAASGHLAVLAEPEGLAVGELAPDTLALTCDAVTAVASRPDAAGGRVGVAGVSGGATLALLAAADPKLAERLSVVVALAPCCDIVEAIRFATTGVYREADVLVPFATRDFFKLVVARSVVAGLPAGRSRTALREHLLALEDYGPQPLEGLRALSRDDLDPTARTVVELLSNADRERFEELLTALPEELAAHFDALSPICAAGRIAAPVELVVGRSDKYVPPADAEAFARACPHVRLTVLDSLEHAIPSFSPAAAHDLLRLDGVLVRLLASARGAPSYSSR